ncbi:Nudix hydrolase 21, chloroplastic [Perkinsus chesapeaki]|uniref:Nudix hydrolase 21, chloroplastic n=1 Tax=Perkinsus chesapeaki TaxID=330153 RepID=A0A7J6MEZ5_PERCH|nr:Nudix hydrolase 21, chloroplastic [Perkinsus chesapeaki]
MTASRSMTLDWAVHEIGNYDMQSSSGKSESSSMGLPTKKWLDTWQKEGMRRTAYAAVLCHFNEQPCLLMFDCPRQANGPAGSRYRLLGGKVAPGETEVDGINRKLRKTILRVDDKQSKCEWTVGEKLLTFWRPEFDEFVYPYLPLYVQRPKECISVYQVTLPHKCVIRSRPGCEIRSIPLTTIYKEGIPEFGKIISAVPPALSRFNLKLYATVAAHRRDSQPGKARKVILI